MSETFGIGFNAFQQIFRPSYIEQKNEDLDTGKESSSSFPSFVTMNYVRSFIETELLELASTFHKNNHYEYNRHGRIGPDKVRFDVSTNVGSLSVDPDRLVVSSQSGFSSIKANCGVYSGRWQYEVMLCSKGVMQIGWCTQRCRFSHEKGVGDTPGSYAYDGNRVRKWNLNTYPYGESWHPGDVIGVCIDLDNTKIEFYRNGQHLGVAFDRITTGPGLCYFPAISLAYNECLIANFGRTPFMYPVYGYQPLEVLSFKEIHRATKLYQWLFDTVSYHFSQEVSDKADNAATTAFLIAMVIIREMDNLVKNKYVVESSLLKNLLNSTRDQAHFILDVFWCYLGIHQMHELLENLITGIIHGYRYSQVTDGDYCSSKVSSVENSLNSSESSESAAKKRRQIPATLATVTYKKQKQYLSLILALVRHPSTRDYILQHFLFEKSRLLQLLDIRPLFDGGLLEQILFSNLTINDINDLGDEKQLRSTELESALTEVESLHHMILDTLIFQNEQCRIQFLSKFSNFIKELALHSLSHISATFNQPQQIAPLSVILSCFHRLTSLVRTQYENMIGEIPINFFIDTTCVGSDLPRLGGLFLHLNKQHVKEVSKQIGGETSTSNWNPLLRHVYMLIDNLIKLYPLGPHSQVGKYHGIEEVMVDFNGSLTCLEALTSKRKRTATSTESLNEFNYTKEILEQEMLLRGRHLAVLNSTIFTPDKRADIMWLLKILIRTLESTSRAGTAFYFVPDYYLETCLNLSFSLRFYFGNQTIFPLLPMQMKLSSHSAATRMYNQQLSCTQQKEYDQIMYDLCSWIATHFCDTRISNVDIKDAVAQALASLVACEDTLRKLECIDPAKRQRMIEFLMQPYEKRAWAHSNWILLRLWKGNGLAYRYTIPPNLRSPFVCTQHISSNMPTCYKGFVSMLSYIKPCPSPSLQAEMRKYLNENPQQASIFITSVLTQLNWSFSEFVGMLQEVQNAANRPEKVFIDSRQLKICVTCFDLSLALLRVIEFTWSCNPSLVTKCGDGELLLNNLCATINQILNRVAIPDGCFEFVIDIPGFESIGHFPIISAVCGILVQLIMNGESDSRSLAINAIINEPSFQPTNLYYVLGPGEYEDLTDIATSISPISSPQQPQAHSSNMETSPADCKDKDWPLNISLITGTIMQNTSNLTNRRPFRIREYIPDISESEISIIKEMFKLLICAYANSERAKKEDDIADEDICTICYASKKTAVFVPCKHQSCKACITIHFVRSNECFFCKAVLEKVTFVDSDQVIFPK